MNALVSSSQGGVMTAQEKVSLALLDQLASCVLLLDESREIVILNTAAETILEASAARLGGSNIAQVIDLDDTLDSLLSQALENNYPVVKRELDILLRGGQRFCVDLVVSPISLEQAPHLLLEFNPVDRLHAISEDEHMWQAQASLRQIIRGLAHEVKNPLGGIRGRGATPGARAGVSDAQRVHRRHYGRSRSPARARRSPIGSKGTPSSSLDEYP